NLGGQLLDAIAPGARRRELDRAGLTTRIRRPDFFNCLSRDLRMPSRCPRGVDTIAVGPSIRNLHWPRKTY
ncbi:MAG: hypothetical protein ACRD3O_18150, partial [Terriglobia bacterium]